MKSKGKTNDADNSGASRGLPQGGQNQDTVAQDAHPDVALQRAATLPSVALTPADILALQRSVGNRAVQRMLARRAQQAASPEPATQDIQPKLSVGPPGDQYEAEADRVARQIMATPSPSDSVRLQPGIEDEEEIRKQAFDTAPSLIAQRVVEEDEQELRKSPLPNPSSSFAQRVVEEDEQELRKSPLPTSVPRVLAGANNLAQGDIANEEFADQASGPAPSEAGFEVTSDIEGQIDAQRGGGSPLDESTRAFMEPRFGADFGGVRVHTDDRADALNQSLGARAFTTGQDIVFRRGEYDPSASQGKELIGHELTHVVQQNSRLTERKLQPFQKIRQIVPGAQRRIQALMDLGTFQKQTDFGKNRKAIAAIDEKLDAYHKAGAEKKAKAIDELLAAVGNYISDKEENDANNARLAPVRDFKKDIEFEKDLITGKLVVRSVKELEDDIFKTPDDELDTISDLLRAIVAPSLRRSLLTQYFMSPKLKTTALVLKLSEKKILADLVTSEPPLAGLIVDHIKALFPTGSKLSKQQRKVVDTIVSHTDSLESLKKMFAVRFDIGKDDIKALPIGKPTASDKEDVTAAVDWDVPGLRKAYIAMAMLPEGHASENPKLKKFQRFKGGGGWFGYEDEVAIGYEKLETTIADTRSYSEKWKGTGKSVFIGKNAFDHTVRHEVGHAVDHKRSFNADYCIGKVDGGNWHEYASGYDMVIEYMGVKDTALWKNPLFGGNEKLIIAKLLDDKPPTVETVKKETLDALRTRANIYKRNKSNAVPDKDLNFPDSMVKNDPVFTDLTQDSLKKPWKSSESPTVNQRTYVFSNSKALFSYETAARARQVSNYQFRAPGEWFAEAYAAYYEPDPDGITHGAKLKEVDKKTYDYFVDNVDKVL